MSTIIIISPGPNQPPPPPPPPGLRSDNEAGADSITSIDGTTVAVFSGPDAAKEARKYLKALE